MSVENRKASFGLSYLGGILLLCVAGALIWLWAARAGSGIETYEQKRAAGRVAKREELAKEVEQKLEATAVLDKEKGIAQIPIDRAMKLVAAELAKKPVVPSSAKVEDPYPYGLPPVPAGATATTGSAGGAVPPPPAPGTPAASAAPSPGAPAASPGGSAQITPVPQSTTPATSVSGTNQEVKPQ